MTVGEGMGCFIFVVGLAIVAIAVMMAFGSTTTVEIRQPVQDPVPVTITVPSGSVVGGVGRLGGRPGSSGGSDAQ